MARLRHLLHAVALAHRAVGKRRVLHLHQRLARVPLVVLRVVVVADAQLGLPLVHLKLAPRVLRRLAREDRRLEHPLPPVLRLRLRRVLRRLQRVDGVVPARLRREGSRRRRAAATSARRAAARRRRRVRPSRAAVGPCTRRAAHRRRRHEVAAVGQLRETDRAGSAAARRRGRPPPQTAAASRARRRRWEGLAKHAKAAQICGQWKASRRHGGDRRLAGSPWPPLAALWFCGRRRDRRSSPRVRPFSACELPVVGAA